MRGRPTRDVPALHVNVKGGRTSTISKAIGSASRSAIGNMRFHDPVSPGLVTRTFQKLSAPARPAACPRLPIVLYAVGLLVTGMWVLTSLPTWIHLH